jgi:hypothetical protein
MKKLRFNRKTGGFELYEGHLCSFGPEAAAGGMLLGEGIVGAEAAGAVAGGGGLFASLAPAASAFKTAIPYISAAGTILQTAQMYTAGKQAKAAGEAQQKMAEYEAEQLETRAGQERAMAQRRMLQARKKTDLAQSRLQALSAAGGGGALDPGVFDLAEDLEGEGEESALYELYTGEERAKGLTSQAGARRTEGTIANEAGRAKRGGYMLSAGGTLLEGAARSYSLYDKYGSRSRGYA